MNIHEKTYSAVVIGSGASGYACAIRLLESGQNAALITENRLSGTSRNTGSDKQTYYKLSLASSDPDSTLAMAEDLFSGGCVDGDTALCEAALSPRGFFSLAELGVPFPCTPYGEYMGYKTDHDRGRRATSAGPYTSRMMTEALEKKAKALSLPVLDKLQAIRLLVRDGKVHGVLCLDLAAPGNALILWADNVVLATGGPAGIYRQSVYPQSQIGGSGMAFEAGVLGKNLTEWQYGMASLKPRWNVSGTYMQVLPRFLSSKPDGTDMHEFLPEFYRDEGEMLSMIFLKGYQWPFDVRKTFGGSSVIDLLVYRETVLRGRRVYLDFMHNPGDHPVCFASLSQEARGYLEQAGACFGTPIDRLRHMNMPAVSFYLDHGVDLSRDLLEIAVCAQHNNGGLSADANWETRIHGLFAIGEVCGSHGITRPGGSALNAGQVGAIRASDCIRLRKKDAPAAEDAADVLRKDAEAFLSLPDRAHGTHPANQVFLDVSARMSACAAMIRNKEEMLRLLSDIEEILSDYPAFISAPTPEQIPLFYRLRDILLTQRAYLLAMCDFAGHAGSRGSALYPDASSPLPCDGLPDLFRCRLDDPGNAQLIQETDAVSGCCMWRSVRPIPQEDYFFENQWTAFRKREGI